MSMEANKKRTDQEVTDQESADIEAWKQELAAFRSVLEAGVDDGEVIFDEEKGEFNVTSDFWEDPAHIERRIIFDRLLSDEKDAKFDREKRAFIVPAKVFESAPSPAAPEAPKESRLVQLDRRVEEINALLKKHELGGVDVKKLSSVEKQQLDITEAEVMKLRKERAALEQERASFFVKKDGEEEDEETRKKRAEARMKRIEWLDREMLRIQTMLENPDLDTAQRKDLERERTNIERERNLLEPVVQAETRPIDGVSPSRRSETAPAAPEPQTPLQRIQEQIELIQKELEGQGKMVFDFDKQEYVKTPELSGGREAALRRDLKTLETLDLFDADPVKLEGARRQAEESGNPARLKEILDAVQYLHEELGGGEENEEEKQGIIGFLQKGFAPFLTKEGKRERRFSNALSDSLAKTVEQAIKSKENDPMKIAEIFIDMIPQGVFPLLDDLKKNNPNGFQEMKRNLMAAAAIKDPAERERKRDEIMAGIATETQQKRFKTLFSEFAKLRDRLGDKKLSKEELEDAQKDLTTWRKKAHGWWGIVKEMGGLFGLGVLIGSFMLLLVLIKQSEKITKGAVKNA